MKLYVLDNGYIEGSYQIFYRENEYDGGGRIVFPVNLFLIETDDAKKILFDTGVFPGGIRAKSSSYRYQSEEQTVEKQLLRCGIVPGDIDAVILSHLHYDHAGCLFLFQGKDFYVSRAEYEAANGENPPAAYAPADYRVDGNWHLLEGDGELFPGIEAVMLPGHTPGMMGLVVHLKSGPVILTQDAVYAADNYYPKCMIPGLIMDEGSYRRSLEKVLHLQTKYNASLIFGHDAAQRKQLKMAPAYYE